MTTEKLDQNLVEKLRKLNTDRNELSLQCGKLYLESVAIKDTLEKMQNAYMALVEQMDNELEELEKKYPNGEIDLIDGTVTY